MGKSVEIPTPPPGLAEERLSLAWRNKKTKKCSCCYEPGEWSQDLASAMLELLSGMKLLCHIFWDWWGRLEDTIITSGISSGHVLYRMAICEMTEDGRVPPSLSTVELVLKLGGD